MPKKSQSKISVSAKRAEIRAALVPFFTPGVECKEYRGWKNGGPRRRATILTDYILEHTKWSRQRRYRGKA